MYVCMGIHPERKSCCVLRSSRCSQYPPCLAFNALGVGKQRLAEHVNFQLLVPPLSSVRVHCEQTVGC